VNVYVAPIARFVMTNVGPLLPTAYEDERFVRVTTGIVPSPLIDRQISVIGIRGETSVLSVALAVAPLFPKASKLPPVVYISSFNFLFPQPAFELVAVCESIVFISETVIVSILKIDPL
jgi:hypothetical protein